MRHSAYICKHPPLRYHHQACSAEAKSIQLHQIPFHVYTCQSRSARLIAEGKTLTESGTARGGQRRGSFGNFRQDPRESLRRIQRRARGSLKNGFSLYFLDTAELQEQGLFEGCARSFYQRELLLPRSFERPTPSCDRSCSPSLKRGLI